MVASAADKLQEESWRCPRSASMALPVKRLAFSGLNLPGIKHPAYAARHEGRRASAVTSSAFSGATLGLAKTQTNNLNRTATDTARLNPTIHLSSVKSISILLKRFS